MLPIVIGHSAHPADAHVASHQDGTDCITGLKRMLPARSGLRISQCAARATCRHSHTHLLEKRAELAQDAFVESRKRQRRLNGNHHAVGRESAGCSCRDHLRQHAGGNRDRFAYHDFVGSARVGGPRFIEVVYFQHQFDGRDAANGVRRKYAEPQRHRSHQLAVNVNRAPAKSARHVGANGLTAHFAENDVLVGSPLILKDADDFNWNGLGFRT